MQGSVSLLVRSVLLKGKTVGKLCLGDFIAAGENPEDFDWFVVLDDRDPVKVKYIEENCGFDNSFYVFGFEHGPHTLVNAMNEFDARDAWIDELPPIDESEVHEAYNAFDKLLEHMQALGHENDQRLRGFCNRWCKFFFDASTRIEGAFDEWPLDEAYEHQSNSTDSGIVHVGHYEWMREVKPESIFFERKPKPSVESDDLVDAHISQ